LVSRGESADFFHWQKSEAQVKFILRNATLFAFRGIRQ